MKFEELYTAEMDQKGKLNSELSLPLGLLVAIGGLLGVMLQSIWFKVEFLAFFFYLAAMVCGAFFFATMYFLVRAYHGQTYKAMPFALRNFFESGNPSTAREILWRHTGRRFPGFRHGPPR